MNKTEQDIKEDFRKSLMLKFEECKSNSTRIHELLFFDAVLAIIENHEISEPLIGSEGISDPPFKTKEI